ncbi:MAG: TMEM165/GDT1 family protein [Leptospirales bacterium]|jgi:putative Ca2+/H+ antiporter (TMEM165/GDT1 family)
MDTTPAIQSFATVFITIFLAEIGDKTQLATLIYATDRALNPWLIFAASALALSCAAGVGVLAGSWLGDLASPRTIRLAAGFAFIAIGIWTIFAGGL